MFSHPVARARLTEFGPEIEDLTSLCGPPTPHHMMEIVLHLPYRQVEVTVLRNTGAADTIMSKELY